MLPSASGTRVAPENVCPVRLSMSATSIVTRERVDASAKRSRKSKSERNQAVVNDTTLGATGADATSRADRVSSLTTQPPIDGVIRTMRRSPAWRNSNPTRVRGARRRYLRNVLSGFLPRDEAFQEAAGLAVRVLDGRVFEEIAGGARDGSADAAVEGELADADGVDHDAGRVGRVLHAEAGLEFDGYVAELLALDPDEAHLVVLQERHVVAGPDVDVAIRQGVRHLAAHGLGQI